MNYSFFITKNMKTQLSSGPIYGTLPILYVFLARTGKTVHEVTFVNLDGDGNVQTSNEPGSKRGNSIAAGRSHHLFRRQRPPADALLFQHQPRRWRRDAERLPRLLRKARRRRQLHQERLLPSAQRRLHEGADFLLEHSATILQDDSGIPLVYFDPKKWRLQPFGRYVPPLSIFPRAYQPRMAELFRKAAPIDFGLGYRWRKNESNLLLAQKLQTGTSESGLSPH